MLVECCKDFYAYFRCTKYRDQGFKMRFRFLLGTSEMYATDRSKPSEIMGRFKRILASVGSAPGLVTNDVPRGQAKVFLKDPALIHEFFLKEQLVCKKHEFSDEKSFYNEYFPFAHTNVAEEERAEFKKFFRKEMLARLLSGLQKDVRNHIDRVENNAKLSGNWKAGTFTADWKNPNLELLDRISNTIIFGQSDEPVRVPSYGNKIFGRVLMDYLDGPYVQTRNSSLNKFLGGLPERMKLLKSARSAAEIRSTLLAIFEKEFAARAQDPHYTPRHCFLDSTGSETSKASQTGRSCPTELLLKQAGMYMISGINTVKRTINGMLYNLAIYPEVAKKLYSELQTNGLGLGSTTQLSIEKLEALPYLEAFLKESLRTLPVFVGSFSRLLLQDFRLGKYQFYKGDVVEAPYIYHHSCEEYFPNPNQFDPERFVHGLSKSVPPSVFLPFGTGTRMCIGRGFAEAVTKLLLVEVLQRFEVTLPSGQPIAEWSNEGGEYLRSHYTVVCTPRTFSDSGDTRKDEAS